MTVTAEQLAEAKRIVREKHPELPMALPAFAGALDPKNAMYNCEAAAKNLAAAQAYLNTLLSTTTELLTAKARIETLEKELVAAKLNECHCGQ